MNKAEIRTYTNKLDIGGPTLEFGIKTFSLNSKKKEVFIN